MIALTHQQARCLDAIREANARFTSPTYEELCASLGLSSKNGVSRLVHALEERGAIRRLPGRARSLVAVDELASRSTADLLAMRQRIDTILGGRAQ